MHEKREGINLTPVGRLITLIEKEGRFKVTSPFCIWAFGTDLRLSLIMTRKEMMRSWNDLHPEITLSDDGCPITDAKRIARLWRNAQ
jgi:hypothetical protein